MSVVQHTVLVKVTYHIFLIVFFYLVKLSETNYTLILKVIYAYTLVFLISEPSNECKLKMKCVGLLKQKQI